MCLLTTKQIFVKQREKGETHLWQLRACEDRIRAERARQRDDCARARGAADHVLRQRRAKRHGRRGARAHLVQGRSGCMNESHDSFGRCALCCFSITYVRCRGCDAWNNCACVFRLSDVKVSEMARERAPMQPRWRPPSATASPFCSCHCRRRPSLASSRPPACGARMQRSACRPRPAHASQPHARPPASPTCSDQALVCVACLFQVFYTGYLM